MAIVDYTWDEKPIDITQEANFIWSIANKLRGVYMPDKYGDVIIPMTILRRFECTLSPTKDVVVKKYEEDPTIAPQALCKESGVQFYNTSKYTLKELCNDEDQHLATDFIAYLDGFSENVQPIFKELKLRDHIRTMGEKGVLLEIIKEFSQLDLSVATYDSIRMGYIFENLIGRFYQNVDAGQYYTGRDIIQTMVSILISEGCDDILKENKVITICDQACGTGGMLTTAYNYIKHLNKSAKIVLYGQEYEAQTFAVCAAEMLIKGQNTRNIRNADTFKEDCFPHEKMRFVLENPPFGTPWKGKDAKSGQEEAVVKEYEKRDSEYTECRWPAGLPSGGDSQLIFLQSAIAKMDDEKGRTAIIQNGSSLFKGDTGSGESQIRRWLLDNDLIEAIIELPTDMFYNTPITTYIWVLSKNKRSERKGKVQLIDASTIYHKLRKSVGNKKNEIQTEDRKQIVSLYSNFEENEYSKIFNNEDFKYREYTTYLPLQNSYAITEERIEQMRSNGSLSKFYDENKVFELENTEELLTQKDEETLHNYLSAKDQYDELITTLQSNVSDKVYYDEDEFRKVIGQMLSKFTKAIIDSVVDGLSMHDENGIVKKDKKGNVLWDKKAADTEIVPYTQDINDYMEKEVWPYDKNRQAFFEENLNAKKPVIKVGAEIPFTRIFYKYNDFEPSENLLNRFKNVDSELTAKIEGLIKGI